MFTLAGVALGVAIWLFISLSINVLEVIEPCGLYPYVFLYLFKPTLTVPTLPAMLILIVLSGLLGC